MVRQSLKSEGAPSEPRVIQSPCPHRDRCGACNGAAEPYEEQLAGKDAYLTELFAPFIAQGAELRPIRGMEIPYGYRDKVTSPFAPGRRGPHGGREILYGMYAPGTHRIVRTEGCLIENPQAAEIIAALPSLMKRFRITPYDEASGRGFLRYAIVRVGHESGEVLVTLVTNGEEFPASRDFCRELVRRCPQITTVVQNINRAATNTILGQTERRLYGPGFILDGLCGLTFRISSRSFYQVNSTQTALLYERAMALAGLTGSQRVIDAYCGTGTLGLVAASRGASSVVGVDSVEAAIRDARNNAQHNGIANARFVAADAAAFMVEAADRGEGADVVFVDPPRSGCSGLFLEALGRLRPKRIVYISCNPETQRRDLEVLSQFGYGVSIIEAVDMFPHTDHCESIALLELRDEPKA